MLRLYIEFALWCLVAPSLAFLICRVSGAAWRQKNGR